ncbi:MAG: bacterial transcriptional activator domain-containing protein [Actinomycetota bacterium]
MPTTTRPPSTADETALTPPPSPAPLLAPHPGSTGSATPDGSASPHGSRQPEPAPFTAGVPYLVAGAVIGYLAALLSRRERWRRPGRRFPKPAPELTESERRVRAVADPDAPKTIDLALRHLASTLAAAPEPVVPGVIAVRCGPLGLEVLLEEPVASAPGKFELGDDGHSWRLDPNITAHELAALAGDQPPPLPALVSAGTTPDGPVLVDLAAIGSLGVTGESDRVTATLRSIGLELATTPWAAGVDLVLVGGDSRLATLERVRTVEPSEALEALRSCARPGAVHDVGLGAAIDAGLVSPTVAVVAPDALSSEELHALIDLAVPGSGLLVVAAGVATTRSVLHLRSHTARLEPPGLELDALPDPVVTDALVTLVADAATPGTDLPESAVAPIVATTPVLQDSEVEDQLSEAPDFAGAADPDPLVWVRVLGPVTVEWRHPASRPQLTELLAFIATHPPQIGADRVRLALWPVDPDDERFGERSPSTLWTLVSKARLALGTDPGGSDLLITLPGNVYQLSPLVACDWVRFESLRKLAADQPERAIKLLREALGLVRGRPFQDIPVGSYSWVGLDRLDSDMAAAIAEAAGMLVTAALAVDDLTTARFAVEQGRLGAPHSEALIRSAMRVAAAAGDREGLDRALRDARRLAQLLDATGEPEPETVRLYEELRRS